MQHSQDTLLLYLLLSRDRWLVWVCMSHDQSRDQTRTMRWDKHVCHQVVCARVCVCVCVYIYCPAIQWRTRNTHLLSGWRRGSPTLWRRFRRRACCSVHIAMAAKCCSLPRPPSVPRRPTGLVAVRVCACMWLYVFVRMHVQMYIGRPYRPCSVMYILSVPSVLSVPFVLFLLSVPSVPSVPFVCPVCPVCPFCLSHLSHLSGHWKSNSLRIYGGLGYIHTYLRAYIRMHTHTYINTIVYTYRHTYTHTQCQIWHHHSSRRVASVSHKPRTPDPFRLLVASLGGQEVCIHTCIHIYTYAWVHECISWSLYGIIQRQGSSMYACIYTYGWMYTCILLSFRFITARHGGMHVCIHAILVLFLCVYVDVHLYLCT